MKRLLVGMLYCLTIFIISCNKNPIGPDSKVKFRTVLVYLAANNSLEPEAYDNMQQMEEAIGNIDGNLLVYAKLKDKAPTLYKVNPKKGDQSGLQPIKEYPPHSSSDPMIMKSIIREAQELYPASTYGLILWSHATGWVPSSQGNIKLRSFGDDSGHVMDITDLNNALPGNLDFIMFDACSMASVEVLYEIKDKAKHFIASPGEVVSNGMPYNKMINDLFYPGAESYTTIAKKYFDHYNSLSGAYRSATISIVESSKLNDLATQTKLTLTANSPIHADFNRKNIQRMDFDRSGNPLIAFDFLDFINQNYHETQNIEEALKQTVTYKANTNYFNGFEIQTNSGLTCYIPTSENNGPTHSFYRTLKWYKDSGFDTLF